MSNYSRQKVDAFVEEVISYGDIVVMQFLTALMKTDVENVKRDTLLMLGKFTQLSLWERGNVVYGLRDQVEDALTHLAHDITQTARREDAKNDQANAGAS